MGRFIKLNEDVGILAKKLLVNQDLCKLLYYDVYNPLEQKNIDPYTVYSERLLMFMPKIFDDDNDKGCYLMIRPDNITPSKGGYYAISNLYFDIMCHYQNRKIEGGDRVLFITDIIDEMMQNARISVGKPNLIVINEIANRSAVFGGYRLVYKDVDFRMSGGDDVAIK